VQYVDSWIFNRGQEITLWKGPRVWRVAVQLFNAEGYPFKYLEGRDRERVLLRALALVKADVAKDSQELEWLNEVPDTGYTSLPAPVHTESQTFEAFMREPEVRDVIDKIRTSIRLRNLEKRSYGGEEVGYD